MADVYEKNLDSKTSLTMNDFIRVVGSDNVSYKQLVSDVADKIITTYAGATLAGSEQSVKNALDGVKNALDGLDSAKQPKTMSQTIGGQTTVEGCLSSLNSKLTSNQIATATPSSAISDGVCRYLVDKTTNTCRISLYARNSANISVGTTLFTLSQGTAPTSGNWGIPGIFVLADGTVMAYYITVDTHGHISQGLSSTVRQVFACGEYSIK